MPFIPLDILVSSDIVQLPESDDRVSNEIPLAPTGVPFGDANITIGYVSRLLSIESRLIVVCVCRRWAPMACSLMDQASIPFPTGHFLRATLFTWWLHSGMMSTSGEAMDGSFIRPSTLDSS